MTIKGMLLTVAGFGGGFNRVDRSSWAAFFCDSRRRFIGYFRVLNTYNRCFEEEI